MRPPKLPLPGRPLAAGLLTLLLVLAPSCDRAPATDVVALPDRPAAPGTQGLVVENTAGDRPTYWDFGHVSYGSRPEHVFRIRNTEGRPVTVLDLLPTCNCTLPRVSVTAADGTVELGNVGGKGPVIVIPPDAIAELAVRIDTTRVERMNVDKLAQVRMRSDSATTPYLTFELHLVVERDLRAVPEQVEIRLSPRSAPKTGRADLVRERFDVGARVTGIERVEGPFAAALDETAIQGQPLWVLTVTPEVGLEPGPAEGAVIVGTTGRDGTGTGAPLRVPVRAEVARELLLQPSALHLGLVSPGAAPLRATLEALVPGERFVILRARLVGLASESLSLSCEPIDPDEEGRAARWNLFLAAESTLSAPEFAGRVEIETDHPRCALVESTYSGKLRRP